MIPSFPRLDAWIHDTHCVSPEGLALYRIVFTSFALLVIAPGHDAYVNLLPLTSLPSSMFAAPPGPMSLLRGFPPAEIAVAIHVLLNFSLAALLFGFRTRIASVATGLLFLIVFGFSYSLGKINHTILFALLPLLMSFSGWGAAFSYDALCGRRQPTASWPLTLLALLVGFAMFTAGFAKVLGGWLDPSTHAAYGHLVKHYFVRGRTDLLASAAVGFESGIFWETVDFVTVLFEIGFLFAILRAGTTRLFAGGAVLFHFGVMLTLNISFVFNVIVYAAFINWRAFVEALPSFDIPARHRPAMRPWAIAAVVLCAAYFYTFGSPLLALDDRFALASDLTAHEVLILALATGIVLLVGIRLLRSWFNRMIVPARHTPST